MQTLLDAALDYAARGWRVLPLHTVANGKCSCGDPKCNGNSRGKHPRFKGWQADATSDPAKIRAWWKQWPAANIGILTGRPGGLVVLDIDGQSGFDRIKKMRLPDTIKGTTGRDHGWHWYFKAPEFPITTDIKPVEDIDIKGEDKKGLGSYVVAAPSIHYSGRRYQFVNLNGKDPAPLPEAIIELLGLRENTPKPKDTAPAPGEPIPDGKRNDTLTSWAGKMRHIGMSFDEILAALIEKNRACDPPLAPADVEGIAQSICRYKPGPDSDDRNGLTDLGLCQRFVRDHGAKLRYCPNLDGWLLWNGHKWANDDRDTVFQLAKKTVQGLYLEAANCNNQAIRKSISTFACASESAAKIAAFLSLAKRELTIPISDLDAASWLLNCQTTVVNFRTGETLTPAPEMLLQKATAATYDPAAKCPLWEKTLQEVFQNETDLIHYFHKATGYALLGENRERVFIECYGSGANGKSVLLNTICKLLGDYGCFTPAATLMSKQPGAIPNDIARLKGRRFVVAAESDQRARISEGVLKLLAGGSDEINARFLHHEWFSFRPSFLVFLLTNHRPRVSGDDEAIWDRIRLIPFDRRFEAAERNLNLENELAQEWPGILNWLIEGAKLAAAEGLGKNEKVATATAAYRQDQNPVARFVADVCETGPGLSWQAKPLFKQYTAWATENKEPITFPQSRFSQGLERLGFKKERVGGRVIYYGLKPIIEAEPDHEPPPDDMERF